MAKPFASAQRSNTLYDTPEWRALRDDHRRIELYCRVCRAEGRMTPVASVDHITAPRGKAALFFDPTNLQSLCKPHHDAKTGQETRARIAPRQRPAEQHPGLVK